MNVKVHVHVKSTVKISSIFVVFLENTNFTLAKEYLELLRKEYSTDEV